MKDYQDHADELENQEAKEWLMKVRVVYKLKKIGQDMWQWGDYMIVRARRYVTPHRRTSYHIYKDGQHRMDCPTLEEAKWTVKDWIERADNQEAIKILEGQS